MRIIAYTYDADVHCVDCARKQFWMGPVAGQAVHRDEHGIPVHQQDSEGNPVHPVFSTDEQLEPLFCGDCGEEIG
jgi:hypothetical protein